MGVATTARAREPARSWTAPGARPAADTAAWLRSRRLMAIDGFFLDLADTPDNAARFGRFTNGHKTSAFPQAHVVALAECGTHAVVAAAIGACSDSERALARPLVDACGPGMLLTADRYSYSFDLWAQVLNTGADLLWRVTAPAPDPKN
ncbi:hypothetical protein FAGKG844_100103 [Frankia sp. AgKG'84/4]